MVGPIFLHWPSIPALLYSHYPFPSSVNRGVQVCHKSGLKSLPKPSMTAQTAFPTATAMNRHQPLWQPLPNPCLWTSRTPCVETLHRYALVQLRTPSQNAFAGQ